MDFYIEILLLPDAEFTSSFLMNSLYSKLHKALYDLSSDSIGVSFPKYNISLGNVLRIHGSSDDLGKLMNLNWIGAMTDYCNISHTTKAPSNSKYRIFSRQQSTMSQAKLRRLIKRGTLDTDTVDNYVLKMKEQVIQTPYLELKSASTGQRYRRFIKIGEITNEFVKGSFDHFGLSKTATVPWF